ncbi:hypothetical protein B0J14DRAFT_703466 [Halenospora varia]|nr:hypothetical protein B0J14DRAFT_703466 [Halenospora varia]
MPFNINLPHLLGRKNEATSTSQPITQPDECILLTSYLQAMSNTRQRGAFTEKIFYRDSNHDLELKNVPSQNRSQKLLFAGGATPTPEQAIAIRKGAFSFPDEFVKKSQTWFQRAIRKTPDGRYQILSTGFVNVIGLYGVLILRTYKQINAEASPILYGENFFVFDSRSDRLKSKTNGMHGEIEINIWIRRLIPGLRNIAGQLVLGPEDTTKVINRLFDKKASQPDFLKHDPLIRFFHRIGRANAAYIRDIRLEGFFKPNS